MLQTATHVQLRAEANRIVATQGARMMRAATRLGEEDGAALASALRDMIGEASVDPAGWPVGDLLSLLERADPTRDRQVVALIGSLRSLAERIGDAAQ